MTKVTILGQSEPKKEKKKIECVKQLCTNGKFLEDRIDPADYNNCMLIEKECVKGLDLFVLWDDNSSIKIIVIGHFNDGEV